MKHVMTPFLMTKIIATVGPSCSTPAVIEEMILAGARGFRINFSHGSFSEFDSLLESIREASRKTGIPAAVIGDLPGPKIRIGTVSGQGILLREDMQVVFTKQAGKEETIVEPKNHRVILSVNYPLFVDEVKRGQRVLIDDGNVILQCTGIGGSGDDRQVTCKVIEGGMISSHKGVNLPDTDLALPALTEKDVTCLSYAVRKKFDFIALSFVRSGKDLAALKQKMTEMGVRHGKGSHTPASAITGARTKADLPALMPVIAKIEKPQAVHHLDGILKETDLVMVARGDLGVEMDLAEVAVLQKQIITACHRHGIPVIVATQMLQSMIEASTPTRAEVSDVANAILDGADAVMLSGETAVGKWPVEAVKMMNRIAVRTNDYIRAGFFENPLMAEAMPRTNRSDALAHGVKTIVKDLKIKMIIVWSRGDGAIALSQYHIPCPILAFNADTQRLIHMSLLNGLTPLFMKQPASGSQFIREVDGMLVKNKWARTHDPVIFVMGEPVDKTDAINRVVVHFVGEAME